MIDALVRASEEKQVGKDVKIKKRAKSVYSAIPGAAEEAVAVAGVLGIPGQRIQQRARCHDVHTDKAIAVTECVRCEQNGDAGFERPADVNRNRVCRRIASTDQRHSTVTAQSQSQHSHGSVIVTAQSQSQSQHSHRG